MAYSDEQIGRALLALDATTPAPWDPNNLNLTEADRNMVVLARLEWEASLKEILKLRAEIERMNSVAVDEKVAQANALAAVNRTHVAAIEALGEQIVEITAQRDEAVSAVAVEIKP
jgi:hypothetical protein